MHTYETRRFLMIAPKVEVNIGELMLQFCTNCI